MILDDELRRLLGSVSCHVLQFPCSECGTRCTWARLSGEIYPVAGCVCSQALVRARVMETKQGWEPYPPAGP